MSDVALNMLRFKNGQSFGSGLTPEFRYACLQALAARLIAGEYVLADTGA